MDCIMRHFTLNLIGRRNSRWIFWIKISISDICFVIVTSLCIYGTWKPKKKPFLRTSGREGFEPKFFTWRLNHKNSWPKKKKKRLHIACSKKNQIKIYLSLAQFTQLGLIIEGPKYSQHDLSLFLSLSLSLSHTHTHKCGPHISCERIVL